MTIFRRYEIIWACDSIVRSPNYTELGKLDAKTKREEMIRELIILGEKY